MYGKTEAREKLSDMAPGLRNRLRKKWIITIAELHPIKRQDVLIKSMKDVIKDQPNAIAVLIGGGEKEVELTELINAANLSEHVFLIGAITEAARFLKAADVFTLTSDSESYGYVLHEAGIAGIPAIATKVGGVTDIIANEAEGLLIEPGNSNELTKKIIHTLQDAELSTKRAALLQAKLLSRTTVKMTEATSAVYQLALK